MLMNNLWNFLIAFSCGIVGKILKVPCFPPLTTGVAKHSF